MHNQVNKPQENKRQSAANENTPTHDGREPGFSFVADNGTKNTPQAELQELANNSSRVKQLKSYQEMANNRLQAQRFIQLQSTTTDDNSPNQPPPPKRNNNTGLPDDLKSGIEHLSGYAMDDVNVHYNSDKPAQLQAKAYAQGQNIYLAQGQEKHLPHEAWHVVQQKQGRVKATGNIQRAKVNDDASLEQEATQMGNRANSYLLNGSGDSPYQFRVHSTFNSKVVQRKKYLELTDSEQEVVDSFVEQQFEGASEKFEMMIGLRAAQDPRANQAASELVERTTLLVETMFFNTDKEKEKSLDEYYGEIFGISDRPDISGGIGPNQEMIKEVFKQGSFREKMTLFYVALAERQTLNKMLLKYHSLLKKEMEVYGQGGAKEDLAHAKRVEELQGLTPYVDKKTKRTYLTQAMKWVQTEIDLERQSQLKAQKVVNEHLTPEERKARREQDENLAAHIINIVNPNGLTGDELDKPKLKQYKGYVTLFMRMSSDLLEMLQKDPAEYQNFIKEIDKQKVEYESQLEKHGERYSEGLGWLKVLMNEVYADHEEEVIEALRQAAKDEDADQADLVDYFKQRVVELAFEAMGNSFKDKGNKRPDTDLKADLIAQLKGAINKLPAWAKLLHQRKEDKTGDLTPDETADKLAEKRFGINFFGASLFHSKKVVEQSRVGGARVMAPNKDQTSEETPQDLEKNELTKLSYRELAAAFYSKEAFAKLLAEFKSKVSVKDSDSLDPAQQEKLRQEMLAEHGDKKLPWKPGMRYWNIGIQSPFYDAAQILKVKIGAAVSGSTDRVMRGAKYLGMDTGELREVLLACLGWMIPAKDHTYYEIMKAGETYVQMAPPKVPFHDLAIDTNYGYGQGYNKMLDFFPDLEEESLPQYLFTLAYKDIIAEKLFPKKETSDSGSLPAEKEEEEEGNLKVLSDQEGKALHTGVPVTYSVRNKKGLPFRFEWFWLRHDSGEGRAKSGSPKNDFNTSWEYKGIYKIYCLVYNTEGDQTSLPVATLRYDQVVFASPKSAAKDAGETTSTAGQDQGEQMVGAKVIFTSLEGQMREVPVRVKVFSLGDKWYGVVHGPDDLQKPEESKKIYLGKVPKGKRIQGNGQVIDTFNEVFRKDQPAAIAQAEAVYLALKEWEKGNKIQETGSLNIDIYDLETNVILKEHFIYTDRLGMNIGDKEEVPSFRIQGGDFDAGIKSHIRLVETRDGRLDVSGNAMVWINFGDKGRMVWWLNNRSDRSYSINFSATSGLVKAIAEHAVPEKEANVKGNEGKPIISADKATHQYAINKETPKDGYPNFELLKKEAVGHVAKMFQWKTFDIKSLEDKSIMPGGTGVLASGFNENLRKAKELEVKIRLLKAMGAPDGEISEFEKQYEAVYAQGQKTWKSDFTYNLRKPGSSDISKKDRRTVDELEERDLFTQRHLLAEGIQKRLQRIVGPVMAKAIGKLDENVSIYKPGSKDKRSPVGLSNAILEHFRVTFEQLRIEVKANPEIMDMVKSLPEEFGQNVITLAVNKEVVRMLESKFGGTKISNSFIKTADREKLFNKLQYNYKGSVAADFGNEPEPEKEDPKSGSDAGSTASKPVLSGVSVPKPGDKTSTKKGGSGSKSDHLASGFGRYTRVDTLQIDPSQLKTDNFQLVASGLAEGGIRNPNNTCYLASVMQMITYSDVYRAHFLNPPNFDLRSPREQAVLRLGRLIIEALRAGNTVSIQLIEEFRLAIVAAGWLGGTRERLGDQQDAAMFMRWLLEDFLHSDVAITEQHDWTKVGRYARTEQKRERVLQIGGLGSQARDDGRSLQGLVNDFYEQPQIERERDGNPIIHRYRVSALPQELTIQVMRYNFNLALGIYTPNNEIIAIDNQLIFQGRTSPEVNRRYTYDLQSFVVHLGATPAGGHYVTYFKKGGQWYYASDANVRTAELAEVNRAKLKGYIYHFVQTNVENVNAPPPQVPAQNPQHQEFIQNPQSFLEYLQRRKGDEPLDDNDELISDIIRELPPNINRQIAQSLQVQEDQIPEPLEDLAETVQAVILSVDF